LPLASRQDSGRAAGGHRQAGGCRRDRQYGGRVGFRCLRYFAAIFGRNFFPGDDAVASLASAFEAFAAPFMMHPPGGALFGHVGDRFGRKRALLLSAALMSSTALLAALPAAGEP
jgi:MFS transporter, MHS family, proline/betaine transporter